MTSPSDLDPYGDPFAEDVHDPVSFALNGANLMYERAQSYRQDFEKQLAAADPAKNIIATSARNAIRAPLHKLAEQVVISRGYAAQLRGLPEDQLDDTFKKFYDAYNEANKTLAEVDHLAQALLTPDATGVGPPEPPLPQVQDWQTVSTQVQNDTAAWAAKVRGKKGQMLILKPSPGVGKTYAMTHTALSEQALRQRVVIAVRTKEMLVTELEPRVKKSGYGQVRLHVIQGRDESTCWNFDNVAAVQAHGYSPGSTVCSRCEYHPDIAKKLQTYSICPYYRSRQNAQNDTAAARLMLHEYPMILTTHSGYLAALESGGGRFGKFWPCDLLMIDEDPTDAFEPEVVITADHLALPTPPKPEDRAAYAMASLMLGAMEEAARERKAAESRGWKDGGHQNAVHGRHGSSYAGRAMFSLIERAASMRGLRSAVQVLRDVSDSHAHPEAGALHGATTAAAVSLVVPPRGLSQIGEALFEENALRMQLRRLAYKKIHQRDLSTSLTSAQLATELAESEEFDAVYRVRLEFARTKSAPEGEWRFVLQNFVNMLDQGTNIIQGDAYANVDHYRQVFDKPATLAGDPSWVDPVTVVNHVAKFPDGSRVDRIRTRANITYLLNEGWQDHLALLGEIFHTYAGQRVVVYGHSVLKERVEKFFADNNNFGIAQWAFENWGGGRGKDQYADWDAVVTISDYVQNIGGMLHKVNARAARDTARLVARGKVDEALVEGTRIGLDMNKADVAHKMADPDTHWRIKQEHDRQNVSELAQALHRVRGLRSPKRMTVVGDGVPFTKDTIAASLVANPPSGPAGRPKLKSGYLDGCLTEDEAYTAICEIEEHFGCWSPAFSHALLAHEVASFLDLADPKMVHAVSSGVGYHLYKKTLYRDGTQPPDNLSHPPGNPDVSGAHLDDRGSLPMGLLRRVCFPPAEWKLGYQRALRELKRVKSANARASREFPFGGRYVPSWEGSAHPGYTWYSRHSAKTGASTFVEIIENQYGINKNGVLYAPNQKPFVPF